MPIDSVAKFVELLKDSRLLDPPQLDELAKLQANFQDVKALARELVRRGWLTAFQVNQLVQGHGKDLVLGPYRLLERLGEGGMGQVFKARHQKMKRVAAVKVIRKDRLTNPDAVKRFYREIEAAAQLSHPNIVHAYDADEVNGTHFFAMEYVEGVDLAKLVKEQGPLSVPQACDCIRQAALGLQHAHERGLVHRDIKPHNLLVTPVAPGSAGGFGSAGGSARGLRARGSPPAEPGATGVVKILDMGLARIRHDPNDPAAGTLTQEGSVMGTLDYIAPEQALDSHRVDSRADLYSLGCTFYFLLTGRVPFPGGTAMEKLMRHRLQEPEPIEKLRSDVPAEVAAIVKKLMAKQAKDRYQTPIEVAAALEPLCPAASLSSASPPRSGMVSVAESQSSAGSTVAFPGSATPASSASGTLTRVAEAKKGKSRWLLIGGAAAGVLLLILLVVFLVQHFGSTNGTPVGQGPEPTKPTPSNPEELPKEITNSIGMKFVLIPKGKSWLGGGGGKPGDKEVEFKDDFYLGAYEVTQEEWERVTGLNPSHFSRKGGGKELVKDIPDAELKRFPVEKVSWDDAQLFLDRLNAREQQAGWVYRLPTEAEWEYACRCGPLRDKLESMFHYYLDKPTNELLPEQANFKHAKLLNRTCEVGSYQPNRLGLHDMHGNLWEWCDDSAVDGKVAWPWVVRGGSWASECQAASRGTAAISDQYRDHYCGLRVARVPVRPQAPPPEPP